MDMRVKNRATIARGHERLLRNVALDVLGRGLDACDPWVAAAETVRLVDGQLTIDGVSYNLKEFDRVYIVGAGKASLAIAEFLHSLLGARVSDSLIVVPESQFGDGRGVKAIVGDHPVPGARSFAAGRALLDMASRVEAGDLILCCVTGGSSALACVPPDGLEEADIAEAHRVLLGSGATIAAMNAVRKRIDRIKGGRLAAAMMPAQIVNLTVSDVAGDPADLITDLTHPDTSTPTDAVKTLTQNGLRDRMPESVLAWLSSSEAWSPDLRDAPIRTVMMITGERACLAMAEEARRQLMTPAILTTCIEGESREVGTVLASIAKECALHGRPFRPPAVIVGCGGETTVTLGEGRFGAGGPNQELAAAFALQIEGVRGIALAAVDTDGSDGGTPAAGAIVDGFTAGRAAEAGVDLKRSLENHDVGQALERLNERIVTGPTGTNVNDMFVVVVAAEARNG